MNVAHREFFIYVNNFRFQKIEVRHQDIGVTQFIDGSPRTRRRTSSSRIASVEGPRKGLRAPAPLDYVLTFEVSTHAVNPGF